jgi:hypothetical protein
MFFGATMWNWRERLRRISERVVAHFRFCGDADFAFCLLKEEDVRDERDFQNDSRLIKICHPLHWGNFSAIFWEAEKV